jgi:hypothetical protein
VSIVATQFRDYVRAVLKYLAPEIPYSEHAVELLVLTAAQETQLGNAIRQLKGPAQGFFQIEPATERYLVERLQRQGGELLRKINSLRLSSPLFDDMVYSLPYACAMARWFYFMKPGPIPVNTKEKAEYYKKHYNTELGKATVAEALANYKRFAGGEPKEL